MQIVETNLQFNPGLKIRSRTVREILHHSAGETGDAYQFHKQHLGQGWAGIGYHFVILPDGTIQRGRPEQYIGSHAGSNGNGDSLGINFVGNFMTHGPTEAQIQAYLWLHQRNEQIYGHLEVVGHRDVMATACPGDMFPMERIKQLIGGNSMVTGPIQGWETQHIQLAVQNGFFSQLHDPREPLCYSELAAILNNFYAKLGGK